jgi:hypothetical protein
MAGRMIYHLPAPQSNILSGVAKKRIDPPRAVRDALLTEFNHRCAVCGKERPQVHHIDEDPSNNDPMNLIPLCPNCHLIDQHNPTVPIDPDKLRLFRRYKDPVILGAQFDPLFRRLRFLNNVEDEIPAHELEAKGGELISFVAALQMGGFYSQRLRLLLDRTPVVAAFNMSRRVDPALERAMRQDDQRYREKLRSVREQVYELAVELLRYQPWEPPKQKARDA